jgi:hypothetical protein
MKPAHRHPFLVGRETEYGLYHREGHSKRIAGKMLEAALERFPAVTGDRHSGQVESSTVFTDGEVLYLDPSRAGLRTWFNLEAAVYESDDPWMLQRRVMRAEARIRVLASEAERRLDLQPGATLILALGDDFYLGRTRGYHFNYYLGRRFDKEDQATLALWAVASSALFGAGGLGGFRGVLCDARIRHLDAITGSSIGDGNRLRGMYCIGRGSLCGGRGLRLHMMHQGNTRLSMVLSDGLTMLVVRAIEKGALACRDPLIEPIQQMKSLNRSQDPLAFRFRTQSGRERGILEILEWFREQLQSFAASSRSDLPSWAGRRILPAFGTILGAARAGDRLYLAGRLDAWMRWRLYDEVVFEKHGLHLAGLARWMPVASLLGRNKLFSHWPAMKKGKGAKIKRLAQVRPELRSTGQQILDRIVEEGGIDPMDPGFPRYMEAIRDLADLEFSLGSAREDNPLPALIKGLYAKPPFSERLLVDPDERPPRARNRSRARSVLIRRHTRKEGEPGRGHRRVHASWNSLVRLEIPEPDGPCRSWVYNLEDPLTRGIPRPRRLESPLRIPARRPEYCLLLAESFGRDLRADENDDSGEELATRRT